MTEFAIRVGGFLRKEVAEIARQPRLVLLLIVGPFVILLLFGVGLGDLSIPVRTAFVVPPDSSFRGLLENFTVPYGSRLQIEGIAEDREEALERLRQGHLDLVVEIPPDAEERFAADEQALVVLHHNFIDPIESRALILTVGRTVSGINDQVLRGLVAQGQSDTEGAAERLARAQRTTRLLRDAIEEGDEEEAGRRREELSQVVGEAEEVLANAAVAPLGVQSLVEAEAGEQPEQVPTLDDVQRRLERFSPAAEDALAEVSAVEADLAEISVALQRFRRLSPQTIVSPFVGRPVPISDIAVGLRDFYAPAVVALLLQHIVVTVVALSVVRDEALGTQELFRVAPLTLPELLAGRYVAATVIGSVLAVAVIATLIVGLGVPMIGSWLWLAATALALVIAACGLGLLLAMLSRSDSQAVQYAMMLLLASIFLGGFVLGLDYFREPVQALARFIPATLGIELFRSIMLRGRAPTEPFAWLVGIAAVLIIVNAALMRQRDRVR